MAAVNFYSANYTKITGHSQNRINSLTTSEDLGLTEGEGLQNYAKVVVYNTAKKEAGSALFKSRADVLVLSHLEVALRTEYLGLNYRRVDQLPLNDIQPTAIIEGADWTPAAEHMAFDQANPPNRIARAAVHTLAQFNNHVDWDAVGAQYRKNYIEQQFVLIFGVCKRGHTTNAISKMCQAIGEELRMSGLDVDADHVFIAYQKWARNLALTHAGWTNFFHGLSQGWAGTERVRTLVDRCRGMGNTGCHIIHSAMTNHQDFNWEHPFGLIPGELDRANAVQAYVNIYPYTFFMNNDAGRPATGGYKGLIKICQYMLEKGGNSTIGRYKGANSHNFTLYPTLCSVIDRYFQQKATAV